MDWIPVSCCCLISEVFSGKVCISSFFSFEAFCTSSSFSKQNKMIKNFCQASQNYLKKFEKPKMYQAPTIKKTQILRNFTSLVPVTVLSLSISIPLTEFILLMPWLPKLQWQLNDQLHFSGQYLQTLSLGFRLLKNILMIKFSLLKNF